MDICSPNQFCITMHSVSLLYYFNKYCCYHFLLNSFSYETMHCMHPFCRLPEVILISEGLAMTRMPCHSCRWRTFYLVVLIGYNIINVVKQLVAVKKKPELWNDYMWALYCIVLLVHHKLHTPVTGVKP